MDNDYEDPDLERFLEIYQRREPSVAVVGDAYNRADAEQLQDTIYSLREEYPRRRFVVAPKCREAFDVLDPETTTLGYANGKSPIQAEELGPARFRGWDVHILGGNPFESYDAIQILTQPTLSNDPPSNIVGYDTNLPMRMCYWQYWSEDGWQDNRFRSPRESARKSFENIKEFFQERDLWPSTEPRELYGEAVISPDEPLYAVSGKDIRNIENLERSFVEEYDNIGTVAFESDTEKKFFEYREGVI